MRLTSQPKDTVIFTVMPDDPTEGTTSPNIIAFSDTTWMLPQSIDIVGIDDPDLDTDQYYNVNVKTMYTNDPDYSHPTTGLLSATREFVNLDDATDKALTACPMGMYGTIESGGVPNCFACPQGTYSDTTKNVTVVGKCKSCYHGTFQDKLGATSESDCRPCPAGKYSSSLSATTCTMCINASYCGIGTIVPLNGKDVLQMQTDYTHGWELVEVPEFQYNFSWWDPQVSSVADS